MAIKINCQPMHLMTNLGTNGFPCMLQQQCPVDDDQQGVLTGSVDNAVEDQHLVMNGKQQLAIGCKDL